MYLKKNKLYFFLFIACIAGYIWLFYNITGFNTTNNTVGVCVFKKITTIPCPSCGTTRSIVSLLQGHFSQALYTNPLGIVVFVIMLVLPFWILADFLLKKTTLFDFYKKTEIWLRKPQITIPSILLVLINWIWNIIKQL